MEPTCYKCGVPILDNYPSHFCYHCRQNIVPKTLAERLTDADIHMLKGMRIRIDSDMIPAGR